MNPWQVVLDELDTNAKVGVVSIAGKKGSAPREKGACMVVASGALVAGTIGGGALEFTALETMSRLIKENRAYLSTCEEIILGPQLQQCCGGVVELCFEVFTQNERVKLKEKSDRLLTNEPSPNLCLFGAGHVGKALIGKLSDLPFDVLWFDNRQDIFPAHLPKTVQPLRWSNPDDIFAALPENSFTIIMTHSHDSDYQIAKASLQSDNICFTGLIGSSTKKARFVSRFYQDGLNARQIDQLKCPVGIKGITAKKPAAIALSITAQLLIESELVKTIKNPVLFPQKTA